MLQGMLLLNLVKEGTAIDLLDVDVLCKPYRVVSLNAVTWTSKNENCEKSSTAMILESIYSTFNCSENGS
jgi:hypothetical protein